MAKHWRALTGKRRLYVSSSLLLCLFTASLAIEFFFIYRQVHVIANTVATREEQNEAAELRHWLIWTDDKGAYALLSVSPLAVERFIDSYDHGIDLIHVAVGHLENMMLDAHDRALLVEFRRWLDGYDRETRRSLAAKAKGHDDEARRIYVATPTEPGDALVDRLNIDMNERLDVASASMVADAQTTELLTALAGFVTIVLGFLVSALLAELLTDQGEPGVNR
ncbi:MAG TPA: hypothetical protein VN603_11785 [Candidatus Acidoferrales bacterium]|nr:hypothetical protein [Candidatus Acidoferrales bacterium]